MKAKYIMRSIFSNTIISLFLLLSNYPLNAQPYYLLNATNFNFTSSNQFQFDIYLSKIGGGNQNYLYGNFVITYDPTILPSGSNLSISYISGSSQLPTQNQSRFCSTSIHEPYLYIRGTGVGFPGAIIPNFPTQIKVGTYRVTNNLTFNHWSINPSWCFTGAQTVTKISYAVTNVSYELSNLCISYAIDYPYGEIAGYEANIINLSQISPSQFEFDIYVKRITYTNIEVHGLAISLLFNDSIRNGGDLTSTYLIGTSEMSTLQIPADPNLGIIVGNNRVLNIAAKYAPSIGAGTVISSNGNGTRLGRFRISTSAVTFADVRLGMKWNFNSYIFGTKTQFTAFLNNNQVDITNQSFHKVMEKDPSYEARLMNDSVINANTYEFDIYLKRTLFYPFVVYGVQLCLAFDDQISNNGVITANYVPGTSEMNVSQIPDDLDVSFVVGIKRALKIRAKYPISASDATMISNVGYGTKLGRFQIKTSSSHFLNVPLNLQWTTNSMYWFNCFLKVYRNSDNEVVDILDLAYHFNDLTNLILPVEFISFSANTISQNSVILKWTTATETNNYGFEIQRKVINQHSVVDNNEFEKIGFVEGSGNSSSTKHYSFVDNQLSGGNKFAYRLKQIDHDGTFSYSSIQEVELTLSKYELTQNYPNPFNPATTIEYSLPQAGDVSLTLYNLLGEKVEEIVNEYKESGIYKVDLDANNLTSGVYIYVLRANGNTISKKMTILR